MHGSDGGVPWEPEKFVEEVVKAGHPMDMATFLPSRLQSLPSVYESTSSCNRVDSRLTSVKFWLKRAMELKRDEGDFHKNVDPACGRGFAWQAHPTVETNA